MPVAEVQRGSGWGLVGFTFLALLMAVLFRVAEPNMPNIFEQMGDITPGTAPEPPPLGGIAMLIALALE